ncbi:MAG: toxin-antitoxin system HicB family antitoxin, partial [Gemmatimonadota bacterium]
MSDTTSLPSGRFVLRIDPERHLVLREAAEETGMSLNAYCAM